MLHIQFFHYCVYMATASNAHRCDSDEVATLVVLEDEILQAPLVQCWMNFTEQCGLYG